MGHVCPFILLHLHHQTNMTNTEPPTAPASTDLTPPSPPQNNRTIRQQLGSALSAISDTVNSNLIIIRYGTVGSIVLLGAYGIANTPLFYRYKSLWDVSEGMWRRKWLHGRIVGVLKHKNVHAASSSKQPRGLSSLQSHSLQNGASSSAQTTYQESHQSDTNSEPTKIDPIVILFRHSSPIERLLTQNVMDKVLFLTGKSPSRMFYSSTNPHRNLLRVELAGIIHPPFSVLSSDGLLNRLSDDKTRVSIQLLAQRASTSSLNAQERIPEEDDTTALCHVTYKKPNQWFSSTNLSLELVSSGQAAISSCVVPESEGSVNAKEKEGKDATTIINFNPSPKQLQQDAAFMSQLEEAEYAAWKSKAGMWSLESTRKMRPEYHEEETCISNLWSTKLFNLLKMGRGWIRR